MTVPRVLIAGMNDKVLQNIVQSLAHYQTNLELIMDDSAEETSLHDFAVRKHADIIIFELSNTDIPKICNDLLNDLPDAVLLGIVSNGRRIIQYALHTTEMGTDELINSIMVAKKRFLEVCS